MEDRDLEGRLRIRLHRRFDNTLVPSELANNVRQAFATSPRRVGFDLGVGGLRIRWAAVVALAVVMVAVAVAGNLGSIFEPGSRPTPTPVPSVAAERQFVVLPANGTLVGKAESTLARSVLSARLRALGISNFTSAGDNVLQFSVPVGGPPDGSIRAVLAATGDLRIVPLPAADYGAGMRVATVGSPLPKDEPALFGWEGVSSVTNDPTGASREVSIALKPEAAQAFGDYTTAHVGDVFAIVVDGRIALLPMVSEAITSGRIRLTPALGDGFADTGAILVGGELPEAWRGASVPIWISQDVAERAALEATHGGTVQAASLSAELATSISGDAWLVVWNVEVDQPECSDGESCVGLFLVKVDGVTGTVLHAGALQPG